MELDSPLDWARNVQKMEVLLLVTSLLAVLPASPAEYRTYTVERECGSGHLSATLTGSGPTSAALLRATDRTSYSLAMDCAVTLLTDLDDGRIVVAIRQIGFRSNVDGTCRDFLQIERRPMCANLFREDEERHFFSPGSAFEMLYHVSEDGTDNVTLTGHPGFQLVATAYTTGSECSAVNSTFRCDNGLCVWSGLKCDTHNNCGDLSDERDCGGEVGGGGSGSVLVILGVLILVLLLIMCVATLLCSKNEKVRRFSTRIRNGTLSFVRRFSR